jgi:alpha-tubulin suppressor-like RCC1 family protein
MPNFSGVWNLKEQIQAIAAGRWTGLPGPELYAWGTNYAGQLGEGISTFDNVSRSSPVQIGAATSWSAVENAGQTIGILSGGLYAWGQASQGQLGTGNVTNRAAPTAVGALTTWVYVAPITGSFSGAIRSDGTLWMWGSSDFGQLGQNNVIPRSSPVQVSSGTPWSRAALGLGHSVAVKTDGTLYAWGWNNTNFGAAGSVGDGTAVRRSSPVQIGALTNWNRVAAGNYFSAALKSDGTLWAWGYNAQGQLGDSTVLSRSSPVQIGSLSTWSQLSAGGNHSLAVKSDGTLWSWGFNSTGSIGDGSTANRSSPVQIGALTNWSTVSASYHSLAVKSDGTLWSWGSNSRGRLGDGTVVNKSSPIQIGGRTNWSHVGAGSASFALTKDLRQ